MVGFTGQFVALENVVIFTLSREQKDARNDSFLSPNNPQCGQEGASASILITMRARGSRQCLLMHISGLIGYPWPATPVFMRFVCGRSMFAMKFS